MKSPLIASIVTFLVVLGFAAYTLGRARGQAEDLPQIWALQRQVASLQDQDQALTNQQSSLRYEAKTNAWQKYFSAEQQVDDLRQQVTLLRGYNSVAIGGLRQSYSELAVCQATVARARQAQAAQGTEAALKILAALLR